jgi:hypothetical protein
VRRTAELGPDGERLAEIAGFLGHRLNSAIRDVIPPEAQVHLLNAQRELLTAVFLIYEHQVAARRGQGESEKEGARAGGRTTTRRRRSSGRGSRVTHIRVD